MGCVRSTQQKLKYFFMFFSVVISNTPRTCDHNMSNLTFPQVPRTEPEQRIPLNEGDHELFRQDGFHLGNCLLSFQHDMGRFLGERWSEDYDEEINKIKGCDSANVLEVFAESIEYGTCGGDAILDDMFTFCSHEEMTLLSDNTRKVLYYFFNMQFA